MGEHAQRLVSNYLPPKLLLHGVFVLEKVENCPAVGMTKSSRRQESLDICVLDFEKTCERDVQLEPQEMARLAHGQGKYLCFPLTM